MYNKLRVCSLFSGAGGIDYAFIQAGCEIIWANENDYDACATYKLNFPNTHLDERDIRNVPEHDIPDFDILVGGFPCQPFSAVGAQKGFQDQRGNLFFEILRIIDAKMPQAVFLENVANLEQHDDGNTFRIIRDELTSRGYSFSYIVADAQDYGFPQRRNRIYIICFCDSSVAMKFSFPSKTKLSKHIFDIINRDADVPDSCYLDPKTTQYKQMDMAIKDPNQIYRFSDGRYGAKGGILSGHNGVSFTLLAGMGNWHDREPIIRDFKGIRKLTPYECFMLQGYPDNFSLKGIPWRSAYRQAGNTVCVPVVKLFADKIVEAMLLERVPKIKNALIGTLSTVKQLKISLENGFYHFPSKFMPENMDEIEYVAIYQSSRLFPENPGVHFVGKIKSYDIVPRSAIVELPKKSAELYCKITVPQWEEITATDIRPPRYGVAVIEKFW